MFYLSFIIRYYFGFFIFRFTLASKSVLLPIFVVFQTRRLSNGGIYCLQLEIILFSDILVDFLLNFIFWDLVFLLLLIEFIFISLNNFFMSEKLYSFIRINLYKFNKFDQVTCTSLLHYVEYTSTFVKFMQITAEISTIALIIQLGTKILQTFT